MLLEDEYGAPRRFRRAWTAFILVLTVAPYLLESWRTPAGFSYTWMLPPYPADSYAYRAWARQAFDGRWLFSMKFTAIPNAPRLFLPFFLAAGRLSRLTGADVGLVLLFMKSVGVLLFFRVLFDYLRHLKLTPPQAVAAAVLTGISSGLGGILALLHIRFSPAWLPIDLWLVDSNTFWSLLWNPLYPYSLSLIVLAVHWTDRGLAEPGDRLAPRAGLCLLALAFVHPYPLAVLYPLLTALCVARRPGSWPAFWLKLVGVSLPGALYLAAVALRDPLIRTHNALGTEESRALAAYLAGFGLPLLLAAGGLIAGGEGFARRYWPLVLWFGLCLILAFSPIWFRSKYVFGAHVPLCILAGVALESLWSRLPRRPAWKTAFAVLVLALTLPTQAVNLRAAAAQIGQDQDGAYRVSDGLAAALRFLESRSARSDVVFAALPTSAKILAFTGDTVLWGHWAQAVDFDDRQGWMRAVFSAGSGLSPDQRRAAFWGAGIDFLFLDGSWRAPFLREPASEVLAGADKIFENREAAIYRRGAGRPFSNSANQPVSSRSWTGSPTSRP